MKTARMKNINRSSILAAALMACGIASAHAAGPTANLQVSAKVNPYCQISADNIYFGDITAEHGEMNGAVGKIWAKCTKTTPYTLSIGAGNGTIAQRQMVGAVSADKLNYNIYTSVGGSTIWGDGTTGETVGLTGTGASQSTEVWARLPDAQYVTPDNYSDTLVVSLSY